MKKALVGGFLSLVGSIWAMVIMLVAGSNLARDVCERFVVEGPRKVGAHAPRDASAKRLDAKHVRRAFQLHFVNLEHAAGKRRLALIAQMHFQHVAVTRIPAVLPAPVGGQKQQLDSVGLALDAVRVGKLDEQRLDVGGDVFALVNDLRAWLGHVSGGNPAGGNPAGGSVSGASPAGGKSAKSGKTR